MTAISLPRNYSIQPTAASDRYRGVLLAAVVTAVAVVLGLAGIALSSALAIAGAGLLAAAGGVVLAFSWLMTAR